MVSASLLRREECQATTELRDERGLVN